MPARNVSQRGEQRKLREQMRGLGMSRAEIAAEMARRYKLRPRAAWRAAWGWTLEEAAERCSALHDQGVPGSKASLTGSRLSEWENWPFSSRKPSITGLFMLAEAYQCDVADLVDAADREKLPASELLTLAKAGSGVVARPRGSYPGHQDEDAASDAGALIPPGSARDFGVSVPPVAGPRGDAGAHGRVAPELVGYFASQLVGHYTADRFLGPMRLIPTALSQYELLCDVAAAAAGSVRGDLWSVAAGYAGLLGWLYQDGGDLRASARWHDVMIERAHRSQDVQLVGFALHCKAMLHADMSDGAGVLDLAGAGLRLQERLCPKVRVLLLQEAAHGVSLTSSQDAAEECGRLLDEAAGLVDTIDDDYPWGGNSRTPRYIDVQRATTCARLGRVREALDLWERVLPDIPASSRRDLGVYRARQARALAVAGEPEQAVSIAAEIVPLVAQTGSARMRAELTGLRRAMGPWQGQRLGRALEEVLAGIEGA